jgi:hypothetical protein
MRNTPPVLRSPAQKRDNDHTTPVHEGFMGMTCADRAPREEILHRAYAIWESEGHPDHRKLENWLAAEAEILPQLKL